MYCVMKLICVPISLVTENRVACKSFNRSLARFNSLFAWPTVNIGKILRPLFSSTKTFRNFAAISRRLPDASSPLTLSSYWISSSPRYSGSTIYVELIELLLWHEHLVSRRLPIWCALHCHLGNVCRNLALTRDNANPKKCCVGIAFTCIFTPNYQKLFPQCVLLRMWRPLKNSSKYLLQLTPHIRIHTK